MKTANDLIEHCKTALKNNVKYVYGAKMEIMTYEKIKALQNTYGKAYVWQSDLQKAGKMCCDCSGLISSCTGIVKNSTMYKATALQTASMEMVKKDWNRYVGWAFWLNGHIGVVSDKEGYYYAMDGSDRNMVHYPISKQKWVMALKLCDIDYNTKTETKKINVDMFGTVRNVEVIEKDGFNYIKLQELNECPELAITYNPNMKMPVVRLDSKPLNVVINGRTQTIHKAINNNNSNVVFLREIVDLCGGTVKYNSNTKMIEIDV